MKKLGILLSNKNIFIEVTNKKIIYLKNVMIHILEIDH